VNIGTSIDVSKSRVFCPNCGKGDQQPAGYCRQCGSLQPDPAQPFHFPHLSRSSVRTSTVANCFAALASFIVAFFLYTVVLGIGGGLVIHALAWVSILVGIWCAIAAWKSFQVEKDFRIASNKGPASASKLRPAVTDKLLEEPDFEQFVPPSVTDGTTSRLAAVPNKSTKS